MMGKKNNKRGDDPSTSGAEEEGLGVPAAGSGESAARPSSDRASRPPRKKPPAVGIAGVPGSKNPDRRCTATVRSTGLQCKRAAIKGGNVCTSHGGAAPQVRKKARERLLDLLDPAIGQLAKLLNREDVDDAVRLRAVTALLDRVGYGPNAKITVDDKRFENLMFKFIDVDRELPESERRALPPRPGGGAESEDLLQHQADLRTENWRTYDAEDAPGRIFPDANTVKGEVLVDPPEHLRDVVEDER